MENILKKKAKKLAMLIIEDYRSNFDEIMDLAYDINYETKNTEIELSGPLMKWNVEDKTGRTYREQPIDGDSNKKLDDDVHLST